MAYPLVALEFAPLHQAPFMTDSQAVVALLHVNDVSTLPAPLTRLVPFEDVTNPPFKRARYPLNILPLISKPKSSLVCVPLFQTKVEDARHTSDPILSQRHTGPLDVDNIVRSRCALVPIGGIDAPMQRLIDIDVALGIRAMMMRGKPKSCHMMDEKSENIPVVLDPVGSLMDEDVFFFAEIPAAI